MACRYLKGREIVFGALPAGKPLSLPADVTEHAVVVNPPAAVIVYLRRGADAAVEKWLVQEEATACVLAEPMRVTELDQKKAAEVLR
jgi:hypothetical protein